MEDDPDDFSNTGSASLAPPVDTRFMDLLARFVFALPSADRRRRAAGFRRTGDLAKARQAVGLAEEAVSALLAGDGGLFEHKLRCVVVQSLGRPVLLELAAYRMQGLMDCDLFRVHVAGSMLRSRLAQDLCAFIGRYLAPTAS